jgi:hypothetical protein
MTKTTPPGVPLSALLATDAATAQRPSGPCHLCQRLIFRGDRYAVLPTGHRAHLPYIARAATS